jgi:hypothetical protein
VALRSRAWGVRADPEGAKTVWADLAVPWGHKVSGRARRGAQQTEGNPCLVEPCQVAHCGCAPLEGKWQTKRSEHWTGRRIASVVAAGFGCAALLGVRAEPSLGEPRSLVRRGLMLRG